MLIALLVLLVALAVLGGVFVAKALWLILIVVLLVALALVTRP